jgi:hypothetical protein
LDNTKKSDTAPSNKTPATPALKPIAWTSKATYLLTDPKKLEVTTIDASTQKANTITFDIPQPNIECTMDKLKEYVGYLNDLGESQYDLLGKWDWWQITKAGSKEHILIEQDINDKSKIAIVPKTP